MTSQLIMIKNKITTSHEEPYQLVARTKVTNFTKTVDTAIVPPFAYSLIKRYGPKLQVVK